MPARIPARLLPHTIAVKPYLGSGAYGDVWGTTETVKRTLVEDHVQLVRDTAGREVTSSTTVYLEPRPLPAGSLVTVWSGTWREREARVIAVASLDHPRGLSHMVLYLE